MTHEQRMTLGGTSAIVGGVLWVASVAWYAQQPFDDDGLREGWDAFNRFVTLIPIFFAAPLYAIQRARRFDSGAPLPRILFAVFAAMGVAAILRFLADVSLIPAFFAIAAILVFTIAFLWYLVLVLRAGDFPRTVTGGLLLATLVMAAFIGSESNLVWFVAPFGVVWILVGSVLILSRGASLSPARR